MTLEGLKNLKKRLLEQDKYFVADLDSLSRDCDVDRFYTGEEIVRSEDSNDIADECSKLLEELTYYLVTNYDNVNQIALDSIVTPIISKSILDDKVIDLEFWSKAEHDKIAKYFMDNYAYVCFEVSEFNTVINGREICDILDQDLYDKISNQFKEIVLKYDTVGFIEYDKFVKNMQALGFKICFYSKKPANTFKDYKNNCFDLCSLDIIANLEDKKIKTKK